MTTNDIILDMTWSGTTTPSTLFTDEVINPTKTIYFDDFTMSSETMPNQDSPNPYETTPYDDISVSGSGDVTIHSGTGSGDDITASSGTSPYGDDVTMSSGTVVFDGDDVTVLFPTVHGDDWSDLTTSTWLDLPEYIPLSVTVPLATQTPPPELTTAPPPSSPSTTTPSTTISTTTTAPSLPPPPGEESNAIDLPDRGVGAESDVSQTNQIARRRVFLRERTRNKRIQELLEEKRNFLLRMKRGQSA